MHRLVSQVGTIVSTIDDRHSQGVDMKQAKKRISHDSASRSEQRTADKPMTVGKLRAIQNLRTQEITEAAYQETAPDLATVFRAVLAALHAANAQVKAARATAAPEPRSVLERHHHLAGLLKLVDTVPAELLPPGLEGLRVPMAVGWDVGPSAYAIGLAFARQVHGIERPAGERPLPRLKDELVVEGRQIDEEVLAWASQAVDRLKTLDLPTYPSPHPLGNVMVNKDLLITRLLSEYRDAVAAARAPQPDPSSLTELRRKIVQHLGERECFGTHRLRKEEFNVPNVVAEDSRLGENLSWLQAEGLVANTYRRDHRPGYFLTLLGHQLFLKMT